MTLEEIKAYCEEHVSYEPWEHGHDCPFYEHRANNGGCVSGNRLRVDWRMEELNEIWEKRNERLD